MGDLTGTVLEGKYRLVRLLGAGGMGSVYEAEHTLIRRRVAVKLLLPQLADVPEMAERFLREARSASEIEHDNIIGIHDVGRSDDGHPFIVMELLEGQSLRQLLDQERRLDLGRATRIALEVLAGLQAAHDQGTIHRDLKPDNVFLLRDDDGAARVKILDFGISKAKDGDAEAALTRTGAVLGTPHYMAPEQAQGEPDVDQRIDIWAAGVILFEMLSGRRPYEGDSYNRVISQILMEPPPRLQQVAPEVPASLAGVVDRALAKDRDERYPDAEAMAAELGPVADELVALMDGETVIAPPAGKDGPTGATGSTETAAQPGLAAEASDGTAPTEAIEGAAGEGSTAAPSWLKRALWVALCLPVPLSILAVASTMPASLVGIVGLADDAHPVVAYGLALALAGGTAVASWQVYRYWAQGVWNRWLQGLGFIVFPAAGLLLVFRAHTALAANMDSAVASFRAYGPITLAQADSVLSSLTSALAGHLSALTLVTLVVAYLALLVLLGQVFAPGGRGEPLFSKRFWLLLPIGLALLVGIEVVYFVRTSSTLPMWISGTYIPWALTAIPILRQRTNATGPRISSWRILLSGLVAQVAVIGVASAVGIIGVFQVLQAQAVGRRSASWEVATTFVTDAIWALGLLTLLLAALLVAACWRSFGWGSGAVAERAKAVAVAVAMVGLTALSTVILVLDNDAVRVAMALPTWKPALVEMVPAALEPNGPAIFYIDRNPSTLHRGREALLDRLKDATRPQRFDRAALLRLLSGHEECPELLEATLGADEPSAAGPEPPPARCVTAIEASLYCEARGKRLPTPAEWDGALKDVAPTEPEAVQRTGPLWRGAFGEWTMERIHGTPTFRVRGGQAAAEDPGQLHPSALSEHVGFRCAFRFDE